jgi:cell division protein FtsB
VLTGAIQEQQKQIDKLRADNEVLKVNNEALKQAVCELNPNASVCAGV